MEIKFVSTYRLRDTLKRLATIMIGTEEFHRRKTGIIGDESYTLGTSNEWWVDVYREKDESIKLYVLRHRYCNTEFMESLQTVLVRLVPIDINHVPYVEGSRWDTSIHSENFEYKVGVYLDEETAIDRGGKEAFRYFKIHGEEFKVDIKRVK